MTDPRQAAIEPRDRMLGHAGLTEAGRLYAGGLDVRDPLVSPLYGDPHGLAPIAVFSSTHELLNTDAQALVDNACDAGVAVDYHEIDGVAHAYPLMPIPEERTARDLIIQTVRG